MRLAGSRHRQARVSRTRAMSVSLWVSVDFSGSYTLAFGAVAMTQAR